MFTIFDDRYENKQGTLHMYNTFSIKYFYLELATAVYVDHSCFKAIAPSVDVRGNFQTVW